VKTTVFLRFDSIGKIRICKRLQLKTKAYFPMVIDNFRTFQIVGETMSGDFQVVLDKSFITL
jgi:hypothetical protein